MTEPILADADGRQGTVMPRLLTRLWARWRGGWSRLPRGSVGRWGVTVCVGFALCAGWSAAITYAGRSLHGRGMQAWDERWLRWIEANTMSFSDAILLESFGNLAYMIPLTLFVAGWLVWRGRPVAAMTVLAAYWLQRPLFMLGWELWDRARPKLIAEGLAAPALHSYPSGHAALVAAGYGLLAWLWLRATRSWLERGVVVVLWVGLLVIVGVSRIRLGAHWPSDVVAGTVLGATWAIVMAVALRRSESLGGR